ncbi:MAG: diheme cytochrome c [Gammaproteobacteria bacterium]|nr:diheme cytochrome c [Gammaproteobacteria bacterium]MBU1775234.1 diheme cytochrome c [Gammaproteobacteria bacterium]MBU1969217.1 diheme cytochrome c [Gammaproteobacteria bacterium]
MKRLLVLLLMVWAGQAGAENVKPPASGYDKWKLECGSCHVAFPPRMLSVENWQELMGGLDKHFGSNAELDKRDRKLIQEFLQRYGGSGPTYTAASLRISDTPWYKREHRVISESEWKLPEVKTKSNCSACHGMKVIGD